MFTPLRHSCAIAALGLLVTGCSMLGGDGDRQRGPSLVDRVLQTPEEDQFPVFSQLPSRGPRPANFTVVMKSHDELVAQREALYTGVEADIMQARSERLISVPVRSDDEPLDILKAAEQVRAEAEADRTAATQQRRQPVPALGGQPPKEQRQ